jgi:hypothetical protein
MGHPYHAKPIAAKRFSRDNPPRKETLSQMT